MSQKKYIVESCVETMEQCIHAEKSGADRIELCARLDLGGTSPEAGFVKEVMEALSIPIKVMVRPRGGNFVYTKREVDHMIKTMNEYYSIGVENIVLGTLHSDNTIDISTLNTLMEAAQKMKITFHKAIDETPDIIEATKLLRKYGHVEAILTSGGADTAWNGRNVLSKMHEICGSEIEVVAAGRITHQNLPTLNKEIRLSAYHGRKIV